MKIYKLFIDVGGCDYVVKLNNVKIQSNAKGNILIAEIPVNEWLIYGINNIDIRIQPLEGKSYPPGAHFELSFFEGPDRHQKSEELFSFKQEELTGAEKINKKGFGTVLEERFKDTLLKDLPVIDLTDKEIIQKLFNISSYIYKLFETEKKEEILKYFQERQLDFGKCYDRDPQIFISNLESSMDVLFGNPEFAILPCKIEDLEMRIAFYGKLITFGFAKFENPFVNFYKKKDTSVMHYFPLYFALNENKEFFVCR